MRRDTIRLTLKADRQYAIAMERADGRVRSDIEIQARFASRLRTMLESGATPQKLRVHLPELEFGDAGKSADRLDRYTLRVCGFAAQSPR